MADLQEMKRIICLHQWQDAREWSAALAEMATLTEQEISELVVASPSHPSATKTARR